MNLFFASTAELYREHRRTQSRRKKEKIAAELQRRHDEQFGMPGKPLIWMCNEGPGLGIKRMPRFNFAIWLP